MEKYFFKKENPNAPQWEIPATIALPFILAGCASEYNLNPATKDVTGFDEKPNEITNLAEEYADFACDEEFEIKVGASAPSERSWMNFSGIPILTFETPLENNIKAGNEAIVRLRITAACTPMIIEGFAPQAIWDVYTEGYDWQEHALSNDAPGELRFNGKVFSATPPFANGSSTWSWNYLSYSEYYSEYFTTGSYQEIDAITLQTWDSVVYEFAYLDTDLLPVPEVFNLSFHYMYWKDVETETHVVASTAVEYMPEGGLDWTGVELSPPGDGIGPAVLYHLE